MASDPGCDSTARIRRERTGERLLAAGASLGLAATVGWVTAALLMVNRGFDITDEGFYLLSYRWWDSNLHSFTGAQFLYGPVFEALQHNVAALRVFRLMTVLVTSASFAVAFSRWLSSQLPGTDTVRWRFASASMVTAAGGLIYAWLPLSPGYNDVAALGIVATATVVLATANYLAAGNHIPAWLPLLGGCLCLLQVLVKWSSSLGLALCAGVLVILLRRSGGAELARFFGLALIGLLTAALLVHLLVVPLDRALPEMWFVNKSAAEEGGSLIGRGLSYLSQMRDLVELSSQLGASILAVSVLSRIVGRRHISPLWAGLVVVAFVAFFALVIRTDSWQGGLGSRVDFNVSLMALAMTVAVAATGIRRPNSGDAAILLMLLLIPLTQAFGTSNQIWRSGSEAYIAWFALMFWLAASAGSRPRARLVAWTATTAALVLVPVIVGTGLLGNPYRTAGFSENTAVAPGIPSIQVSPEDAHGYAALRDAVRPHLHSDPTPILALDTMPGLIYVVGGTAAGETWTGRTLRTGEVFNRACRQGEIGRENPPLVFFATHIDEHDLMVLERCGFDPDQDFREIDVPAGPRGIRVLVPTR